MSSLERKADDDAMTSTDTPDDGVKVKVDDDSSAKRNIEINADVKIEEDGATNSEGKGETKAAAALQ